MSSGDTGRVVALASMVGHPELTEADVVVRGVLRSASGNEQYYALLAARAGWHRLDDTARREILDCIKGAGLAGRYIADDPHRAAVARQLLLAAGEPVTQ